MTPPPDLSGAAAPHPNWASPTAVALVIGAVTALRLGYLAVFPFDLHPDEAQYWSWSRDLDWGYFSKPPMVAWLIAATTALCGDGEGCVKLSVPVLHGITAGFIYGAAARLYEPRAGFFAALLYLTLPAVSYSATIMSTDPPLLTCWAAAFYLLVRLREAEGRGRGLWLLLGLALGLGLMSKYAMAYFAAALGVLLALDGAARDALLGRPRRWAGPVLALAVAAAIVLPNLVWNLSAGFVTFAHTAANANLGGTLFRPEKFFEFLTSQFGVFGPISFAALLGLLLRPDRWLRDPRARFLAAFVLASLLPILVLSGISRANANWAATAYVAGSVWLGGALAGRLGRAALIASVALHVAVVGGVLAASIGQPKPGLYAGYEMPARIDPYRHYGGWRALWVEVNAITARHPGLPLLASDRMTTASALYYARPRPVKIHAWKPRDAVKNHFQLTRPWAAAPGADAILVLRPDRGRGVRRRFSGLELFATVEVPIATGATRRLQVFHAKGFMGYKRRQP